MSLLTMHSQRLSQAFPFRRRTLWFGAAALAACIGGAGWMNSGNHGSAAFTLSPIFSARGHLNDQATSGLLGERSDNLLEVFQPAAGEHPISPIVRWAESRIHELRDVEDYDCMFCKRELVNGTLRPAETIYLRMRHKPLSVYMKFLAPSSSEGKEVIYVADRNQGRLQAHLSGVKRIVGTRSLMPTSRLAMRGNRYPITQVGLLNLTQRLIEAGKAEMNCATCVVNLSRAQVNEHACTKIEVLHPVREPDQRYQRALIYIDDKLNVPIRYEAYAWQDNNTGDSEPYEEYTYTRMRFNVGLDDIAFHTSNPEYDFE